MPQPTSSFKALWISDTATGWSRSIEEKPLEILPPGDVLVQVLYTSLNYKDALSATGNRGVTRSYPHIPGVDAAGVVIESARAEFKPGDEVVITGYELGSNAWGGWSEYIRVPAGWVVPRPSGLTLRECMILGTAGFTAGLSAHKLLQTGLSTGSGPILVTGATGGVGCLAVAILSRIGFSVTAMTGKPQEHDFLKGLGASTIIDRKDILGESSKALLSGRWAGVVDTVGGRLLETAIRQTRPEGAVACCGNIASAELHTSIYPFILRGVSLLGIGSAFTPMQTRLNVWRLLSTDWKLPNLHGLAVESSLGEVNQKYIDLILRGGVRGRVLIPLTRK